MACHFHLGGVVKESVGDPLNLGCHGGREEQRLAGFGGHLEDAFDIGDEPHIQHPVGLIDHHDLHARQQQFAALEMVKQAAGGGDQHIHAAVDQLVLVAKRYTTDQQSLGQLGVFGIFVKAFRHLGGQFACGGQHKRARHARACASLAQKRDHGQGKARRLARAGLGDAQNVLSAQRGRDGLGLNGRGGFVTGFDHGLQHTWVQF